MMNGGQGQNRSFPETENRADERFLYFRERQQRTVVPWIAVTFHFAA